MTNMRILFYGPFNQRSRDTESVMIAFRQQGHHVILLSQARGLLISEFLKTKDIETFSFIPQTRFGWIKHCQHVYFLARFCWSNKVEVVYSHLESANFIASIAQFFVRAKVYICRHHSDQYKLLGQDKDLSYRFTYALAKKIIVVSEATKNYMIANEGIPENKIIRINLAYDFSLYGKTDQRQIEDIKKTVFSEIILITVGSLNPLKRPDISIGVLNALVEKGYDAKLVLLGTGELYSSLKTQAETLELTERVIFPGYVENVLDYMTVASYLIHPSVSESSCVVVKEAGLVFKPVIACNGVGDFQDYIVNAENGFLVDPNKFVEASTEIITKHLHNEGLLLQIGKNLNQSVLNHFSIQHVISKYDSLNTIR